jgi:hypothetical protein
MEVEIEEQVCLPNLNLTMRCTQVDSEIFCFLPERNIGISFEADEAFFLFFLGKPALLLNCRSKD